MRRKGIDLAAPNRVLALKRDFMTHGDLVAVYTDEELGFQSTDPRRYTTSTESLGRSPAGRAREPIGTPGPGVSGVHLVDAEYVLRVQGGLLYDMRTRPHVFFEEQVESAVEHAHALAKRAGMLVADCHTCHVTMPVAPDAESCALCGTEF